VIKIKDHRDWKQESRSLAIMTMPDGKLGYIALFRHDPKQAISIIAVAVLIFAVFLFGCFVMGILQRDGTSSIIPFIGA
jgi:hypothetical protein